ncbi:MAG: hypothetical protein IPO35_16655 [Uliginosibacterium sp.]|nr:hypothetical protein [Uliginosibacterium sp.]
MAAISSTNLACSGRAPSVSRRLFGNTNSVFNTLKNLVLKSRLSRDKSPMLERRAAAHKIPVRCLSYGGNPCTQIADRPWHRHAVRRARPGLTVVDNTMTSPWSFRPRPWRGLVINSLSSTSAATATPPRWLGHRDRASPDWTRASRT